MTETQPEVSTEDLGDAVDTISAAVDAGQALAQEVLDILEESPEHRPPRLGVAKKLLREFLGSED